MTLEELSHNAQDYLKMIWGLHDWGQTAVQPSDLAKKAGVKPSTVTGAVARLVSGGYAEHDPYGAITLTSKGERYALAMVRRHRLLETFLVSKLNYGSTESTLFWAIPSRIRTAIRFLSPTARCLGWRRCRFRKPRATAWSSSNG